MKVLRLLCLAPLVGCVGLDEPVAAEDLAEGEHMIFGPDAVLATQSQANRMVAMLRATNPARPDPYRVCTGTFIDDNHAITAAHCNINVGDQVAFYTTPNNFDPNRIRTIVAVGVRSDVDADDEEYTDSNGNWADFAIVRLAATAGAPAVVAALDWQTPTMGELGAKVGGGGHNGATNGDGTLLRIGDTIRAPNEDGIFITTLDQVNHGDSGGAFFTAKGGVGLWLSGVLSDWRTVGNGVQRAAYTDIATHLDWILDVISYAWVGGSVSSSFREGTILTSFPAARRVCQYACERTSACTAFNYAAALNLCIHLSSVTTATSSGTWISDVKP